MYAPQMLVWVWVYAYVARWIHTHEDMNMAHMKLEITFLHPYTHVSKGSQHVSDIRGSRVQKGPCVQSSSRAATAPTLPLPARNARVQRVRGQCEHHGGVNYQRSILQTEQKSV